LRAREAHLSHLQHALHELARLSALALHGAFGDALHLGLELSASRGWQPSIEASSDAADVVQCIRRQLSLFGAVEELSVDLSGPVVRGELRLNAACALTEGRALSHWVAAYAIECLNLVLPAPLRLDGVQGHGAAQSYAFTATRRAAEMLDQLPSGSSGTRRIAQASNEDATRVA
jgi:hypothetical protein